MTDGSKPNIILVTCGKCGKKYRVPASAAGKRAKCSGCGQPIEVPLPTPPQEVMSEELPTEPTPPPPPTAPAQPGQPLKLSASAQALADSLRRKKAAKKKQNMIVAGIAFAVLATMVFAWVIPGGPPEDDTTKKKAAAPAEVKPPAVQSAETIKDIEDLASADKEVRSNAAFKLGERIDQVSFSIPALKQALEKETDAEVKGEMEKALKRLGSK